LLIFLIHNGKPTWVFLLSCGGVLEKYFEHLLYSAMKIKVYRLFRIAHVGHSSNVAASPGD